MIITIICSKIDPSDRIMIEYRSSSSSRDKYFCSYSVLKKKRKMMEKICYIVISVLALLGKNLGIVELAIGI